MCAARASLSWACVCAICAFLLLLVLPAVDFPETNFDEANTPTNEMVVQERSVCSVCMLSFKAVVPPLFVHTRRTRESNLDLNRPAALTDSLYPQELLCTLRC
jgi:hypothetical protein